jgi:hypothetical protein
MVEERKRTGIKVCGWISNDLYLALTAEGYKSPTEIVREGARVLLEATQKAQTEEHKGTYQGTEDNTKERSENNVREQEGTIKELRAQTQEQREHIETLKIELNRAERDKEDLKSTYNNYFLQVQTLINQKAIEAPGSKKPWYKFWR